MPTMYQAFVIGAFNTSVYKTDKISDLIELNSNGETDDKKYRYIMYHVRW